jgi:hypothetical protein
MSNSVYYYIQECPTCGRSLRVRVAYLGRQVACQHCDARFTAVDPASVLEDVSDSSSSLLDRAAQLLESVERRHGVSG